jgi:hypothetical protein
MVHNYEAGGSNAGGERSHQFTLDEALLYRHHIPVPMEYRLPHGWQLSTGGYTVPLAPPDGP